jgi:hypothetical protein
MMAQSGEKRDASFFFLAPKLEKFPLGGKLWWLVGENHGGSFTFSQVGNTMWSIEKNVERYIRLSKGVYRDEGANTTGNTRSTISAMGKYIFFLLVVIHGLVGGASIHRCVLIAKSAGRNGENGIGLV